MTTSAATEPLVLRSATGWTAAVVRHGARLHSLRTPPTTGAVELVVGPTDPTVYATTRAPLGVTVGRVANRIRDARFVLDGHVVEVTANEGPHQLHGGGRGAFGSVVWDVVERRTDHVRLRHVSAAGSEGFPGEVHAEVSHTLRDASLTVVMTATTTAPTPVAMTNHAYWNLAGEGGSVLDHELAVAAGAVAAVDEARVPTGADVAVAGTPLDLRSPRPLREVVAALAGTSAGGLDHAYLLDDSGGAVREVARLREPGSGRTLVVASDQVCLQVFVDDANRLPWRDGVTSRPAAAVCLEPHAVPNAVNLLAFPSPVLRPGEQYRNELRIDVVDPAGAP